MSIRSGNRFILDSQRAAILCSVLGLSLSLACATVEAPSGGPADLTPPYVVRARPESAAVGLVGIDKLELIFSEKVDPRAAERFLKIYPDPGIRKTRWHSRRRVEIFLATPLPGDTVIIVEIPPGFPDVHRVATRTLWQMPLATSDSLPTGSIRGRLMQKDEPVVDAVVELYAVPPETLDWEEQKPLRRVATDSLGTYQFKWLPAESGPFLLRAFQDRNKDFRAGDNEAQRLLPGEFDFEPGNALVEAGLHILYSPNEPGRLVSEATDSLHLGAAIMGWPLLIAEQDTGFVPQHSVRSPKGWAVVSGSDSTIWDPAGPGLLRLVIFADLDQDSLLSAIPVDTLRVSVLIPDSARIDTTGQYEAQPESIAFREVEVDSIVWRWEPYGLLDSLIVSPGLPIFVNLPDLPDTLAICLIAPPIPEPAQTDSLKTATSDSLRRAADDGLDLKGVADD